MQDAYSFVEEIVSKQKVYEYSYKRNEVIEKALDQPRGQLDTHKRSTAWYKQPTLKQAFFNSGL